MSLGLDEEKAKELNAERAVDANYGKLRVIWLGILATLVVMFVVTRLVKPGNDGPAYLFWILLALGVFTLCASFVMKHKILKAAVEQRKPEIVRNAYIVALALAESSGQFGLVAYFATGNKYYYFFFVLAGFGIMLHKPQREDVLAATRGPGALWETKKRS